MGAENSAATATESKEERAWRKQQQQQGQRPQQIGTEHQSR